MRCAWENLESSLGTYTFTALSANIAKVQAWGKKVAISLSTSGFYPARTHSRAPSYIVADNVTYGGLVGSGGELQSTLSDGNGQFNTVNLWNVNVFNRFKALIDALAVQYDGVIEYIHFDEMCTQITDAEVAAVGGKEAIALKQLEVYAYIKSKFILSTVFVKMNYLSGSWASTPPRKEVWDNLNYHKNNNRTAAIELAFPYTPNPDYPNFTPSISTAHLDVNHEIVRTFPSAQRRYFHVESNGGTMADTSSSVQCRQAIRWAAYMAQGCENPICRITITDGIGGGPNPSNYGLEWAALSPYLTSRYLRS